MASPGDKIDPTDHILSKLSDPPAADEFPAVMICPSGHRVSRYVIKTPEDPGSSVAQAYRDIPCWVCQACVVVYRYQECTLVPGEEGHA